MSKTYNLFISHSWAHSDAYENLINLLNKDTTFSYKNYSVSRYDPIHNARTDQKLYEAIKAQIAPASVVLILAGVYSSYSKWIDKEIKISKKDFFKPIIAIQPWGAERTSIVVKESADKIVGWNRSSIINAIKELSK